MTPTTSHVLPPDAVAALQKAAATPTNRPDRLCPRQMAIEKATARIKQQYPQFFTIKEIQNETETQ